VERVHDQEGSHDQDHTIGNLRTVIRKLS
jgi:hypothetical protein